MSKKRKKYQYPAPALSYQKGKEKPDEPPATKKYEGKNKLFAYGTLNIHSVQRWLWGEQKEGKVAGLIDYELDRYSNNILFINRKVGESVAGKVYELTDEQLDATDSYEGEMYTRQQVTIAEQQVYVYVQNKEWLQNEISRINTEKD